MYAAKERHRQRFLVSLFCVSSEWNFTDVPFQSFIDIKDRTLTKLDARRGLGKF
jgi:hypothetical protein